MQDKIMTLFCGALLSVFALLSIFVTIIYVRIRSQKKDVDEFGIPYL